MSDDLHVYDLFNRRPPAETPIACDLSVLDHPEQHRRDAERLFGERIDLRAVEGGYAFRFPGTIDYAERLLAFIRNERRCCTFLTFEIVFEPEGRGVWLYMGGDDRVKDYLAEELGESTEKA